MNAFIPPSSSLSKIQSPVPLKRACKRARSRCSTLRLCATCWNGRVAVGRDRTGWGHRAAGIARII